MISGPSTIPSDSLITFSRGFRFGGTVTPNPTGGVGFVFPIPRHLLVHSYSEIEEVDV